MQHLFKAWLTLEELLHHTERILLLSDFDGTLAPIAATPEMAEIPGATRSVLQDMVRQDNVKVGIISGRSLTDLKNKLLLEGVIYVGNHGCEIEGPELHYILPPAEKFRPALNFIYHLLCAALETTLGVFVENKGLSLSVHYRLVAEENMALFKETLRRTLEIASRLTKFKVTQGKKVYELRPNVDWNKGKAVQLLLNRYSPCPGRRDQIVPIYLGDDLTDEDGFCSINGYNNGISVYIGKPDRPTSAEYYLNSPDEAAFFLKKLVGHLLNRK